MEPLPWWRALAPVIAFIVLALICWRREVPLLQIIFSASLTLIVYGMVQDQVSARLCPEYFTVGHPPLQGVSDPTLLGLSWGFLGGFPGGIMLGIPLALAAQLGPWPRLPAALIRRPLLLLAGIAALGTIIAGMSGWYNAGVVNISIGPPWAELIPEERHRPFFIVASAHFGTYLSTALAGLGLCGWIISRRVGGQSVPGNHDDV